MADPMMGGRHVFGISRSYADRSIVQNLIKSDESCLILLYFLENETTDAIR